MSLLHRLGNGSSWYYLENYCWLTLIGTGILEEHHPASFEMQASLLSEEEIGAFHDILEVRFSFSINQRCHVGNVHGLRAAMSN